MPGVHIILAADGYSLRLKSIILFIRLEGYFDLLFLLTKYVEFKMN